MKIGISQPRSTRKSGFTLIEMIGVIAVMAILAAVITPNALRTVDRAAVRAEDQLLRELGSQVKYFFQIRGWLPGTNILSWDRDLAPFVDMGLPDLITNKRQVPRAFIYEPTATPNRLLIISAMHSGLVLPTATDLNTAARFDSAWNTVDGQVPAGGWPGWTAWRTGLNNTAGEYLVVERVNIASLYMSVLLTNNSPGNTVSYIVVPVIGAPYGADIIPTQRTTLTLRPNDRVNLYRAAGGAGAPDYSYIASSGAKKIDFNDTKFWLPQ